MRLPSARRSIPSLLLFGALIVPAAAPSAEPVKIAAPFSSGGGEVGAAAESGCRSRNVIEFREADTALRYEVRHFGRIRCADDTPLKHTSCFTTLLKERDDGTLDQISRDEGSGRDRCRAGSPYQGSHEANDRFVEKYGYNLTLRRGFQWRQADGTYCHRTNDQRTLVCRDQHSTRAPLRDVEVHNSSD